MQKVFHPFDPFVILFVAGFTLAGIYFLYKVIRWIEKLSADDRDLLISGIFTKKTWMALGETIRESLLHRRLFGIHRRLGYMHLSLAFGWFMLILIGNIESIYYSGRLFKPIYLSVFWRFFDPGPAFPQAVLIPGFAFWMDFFLLMVLSGLALAIYKRFRSAWLGMKRTTRLRAADKFALNALWLIFPVRLLAESATCGANGTGSFLTGSLGHLMAGIIDPHPLILPLWWAYSFVLMLFFISLPFTRYMHIPSEPVLIFLRNYGIKVSAASPGFTDLSLHSCSSCGVCIDACQLAGVSDHPIQSSYFIRSARAGIDSGAAWECLHCGRCESVCPVGLELMPLRLVNRKDAGSGRRVGNQPVMPHKWDHPRILYFAGCMSHLTPSIILAMTRIFKEAGSEWEFYDPDGGSCCGRPLKLAGQVEGARIVQERLQADFLSTGAQLLVTSCPICLRTFREDYRLPGMTVIHHTQYILELLEWNRIKPEKLALTAVWHEPCELGRGSGIRREPAEILSTLYAKDLTPQGEGLCCGGSLGGPRLAIGDRKKVARQAFERISAGQPDVFLTACPLCKKTFTPVSDIPVLDFAEAVAGALGRKIPAPERLKSAKELESLPVTS
jgi:Fe-S oxidoreductase